MKRRAFTVIELMIVISIIALLAAMAASALSNAAESAREQRTRAIIRKLDQLVMERWDGYRTRAIPYTHHPTNNRITAMNRLNALRELQRLELPQTIEDVTDNPIYLTALPSINRAYRRKASASWDGAYEESECLYLIVSGMRDGDSSALEYFTSSEIGDTDSDGMPEILDGWGQPIMFLRWPAGYRSDATVSALTTQSRGIPDQFDPIRVDPLNSDADTTNDTFALKPLIYSMGADGENGITITGPSFQYSQTSRVKNDPYDASDIGAISSAGDAADNITNHAP